MAEPISEPVVNNNAEEIRSLLHQMNEEMKKADKANHRQVLTMALQVYAYLQRASGNYDKESAKEIAKMLEENVELRKATYAKISDGIFTAVEVAIQGGAALAGFGLFGAGVQQGASIASNFGVYGVRGIHDWTKELTQGERMQLEHISEVFKLAQRDLNENKGRANQLHTSTLDNMRGVINGEHDAVRGVLQTG